MSQEYPRVYIQVNYRQCMHFLQIQMFSVRTQAPGVIYIFSHNKAINSLPNNTHCVLLNTWGCTRILLLREKI